MFDDNNNLLPAWTTTINPLDPRAVEMGITYSDYLKILGVIVPSEHPDFWADVNTPEKHFGSTVLRDRLEKLRQRGVVTKAPKGV